VGFRKTGVDNVSLGYYAGYTRILMDKSFHKFVLFLFVLILIIFLVLLGVYIIGSNSKNGVCRGVFGKPIGGEFIGEMGGDGFSALRFKVCVSGKNEVKEGEEILDLAFFNKFWIRKKYVAQIGSKDGVVGFCRTTDCELMPVSDAYRIINVGDYVEVYIVKQDTKEEYFDLTKNLSEYQAFLSGLMTASTDKKGYPEQKDNLIYISQIDY
jgi:hypothetical protein